MSAKKKLIREQFRNAVFSRDGHKCRVCGWSVFTDGIVLDAHHITDRNEMPNGGYVMENGISLCNTCHEKAEIFHTSGKAEPGWSPNDLYVLIQSTHEKALNASKKLDS